MKFLCWCPDMGHEDPEEDGEEFDSYDAGEAARDYVEKHFSDWSYPRDSDVLVRNPAGIVFAVNVTVESVPSFSSSTPKEVQP